uniref:Uncharacterized protein n=1 Tax=Plectus sambesii TaxID=2011161 RepID=A0A914UUZ8_9BILA
MRGPQPPPPKSSSPATRPSFSTTVYAVVCSQQQPVSRAETRINHEQVLLLLARGRHRLGGWLAGLPTGLATDPTRDSISSLDDGRSCARR